MHRYRASCLEFGQKSETVEPPYNRLKKKEKCKNDSCYALSGCANQTTVQFYPGLCKLLTLIAAYNLDRYMNKQIEHPSVLNSTVEWG